MPISTQETLEALSQNQAPFLFLGNGVLLMCKNAISFVKLHS